MIDKVENIFVVPRMVPHRDAMNSPLKQSLAISCGDAPSTCRIFPIGDHEIRVIFFLQKRQVLFAPLFCPLTDDISDK